VLQEKYLPGFHFNEKHSIVISASPEIIASQIETLDASSSWIVRALLAMRGIPKGTSKGIEGWKKMGFILLEQQDKEIILGLMGQFWKASGNVQKVEAEKFVSFSDSEFAKATWNFEIKPYKTNQVVLETETRILCMNENTRKKFGRYWFFIRPFSGLIRMQMLKAIKKKAERES
jgi:hypothetical protein